MPSAQDTIISGGFEGTPLLRRLAQEICDSMAEIIGYNVFITDDQGIIIACSDPARGFGTFHEASLRAIRDNRWYTETEEDARRFQGTNPGITAPLNTPDGTVVGTIAITGEPEKVNPFTRIVKKQAEMILRQQLLLEASFNREQALRNLAQRIMAFDRERDDGTSLLRSIKGYGLSPDSPYRAIGIEIPGLGGTGPSEEDPSFGSDSRSHRELLSQTAPPRVLLEIRSVFSATGTLCVQTETDCFLVLHPLSPTSNQKMEDIGKTWSRCLMLVERLGWTQLRTTLGIGGLSRNLGEMGKSMAEAWRALDIGKSLKPSETVFCIDGFRMEELLHSARGDLRNILCLEELGNLKEQPDWPELRTTCLVWCLSNRNASEASRMLNIHRNTLHYRLGKISRISGKDPRDFRQLVRLYIAITLDTLGESPRP